MKMTTITDRNTNQTSKISRTYRVQNGVARLFVGRDRKIWIGYGDSPEGFSYVADLPADESMTRDNVCRAANCW